MLNGWNQSMTTCYRKHSGAFATCVLRNLPIVTTKAKFMPGLRKRLSENLKELNHYLSWQSISQKIFKLYTDLHYKC